MSSQLLYLLQLTNSTLPVGAYSYSEGLESLVQQQVITTSDDLKSWLEAELKYGAVRIEAAVMIRAYQSYQQQDAANLNYWNDWLSASRETAELRQQSQQTGQALMRLLRHLEPNLDQIPQTPVNWAIAFAIAAACWQINLNSTIVGFLHAWATNLVGAGVKLVPLGQTAGQQLLVDLQPSLLGATEAVVNLSDDDLSGCGWGLALASMAHETQYSRLFRS